MYIHVVAPTLWDKMEHLRELQWVLAVVDLYRRRVMSANQCKNKRGDLRSVLTMSRPVTFTMSDATDVEEGCASRVVTLCCTFWKGNDCVAKGDIKIGWSEACASGRLKGEKYSPLASR
jgi:hypothetical protein